MKRLFFLLVFANLSFAQYDTIIVKAGWNNIGSVQTGMPPQIINTIPPGIIISPYWGYNPGGGYFNEDTLKRGGGYWIKCNQDGLVIFGVVCGVTQVNYEGKLYNTVQIGSQCWLMENLDVGTMIQGSQNATNNGIIEKYCYNNTPSNCTTYGGLYQWNEAMQYTTTQGGKGICPTGWHIPTFAEFQALSSAVGGNSNALKAVGQGSGGGAGTNTSGFSALLAGYRSYDGPFAALGNNASLWSSTMSSATSAYDMALIYNSSTIFLGVDDKELGFSVRCLKD